MGEMQYSHCIMKFLVILNPYANRWRAANGKEAICRAFDAAKLDYTLAPTSGEGDAIRLARHAARDGFQAVVAAGGDGTVHEVVNGLMQAAKTAVDDRPTLPLGILPLGNGNDFNDLLGLPRDVSEIAKILSAGHTHLIDVGEVNDIFFNNNCAAAMEPLVTLESRKLKNITGNLRYILGLMRALLKLKAWEMSIEWEGGSYHGPTYLLSVCNGRRVGKLFTIAPDAEFDDGVFDVIFAPKMSMPRVIQFLSRLIFAKHLDHPDVKHFRTPWIRFTSKPGTPIHADGEILTDAWTDVDIRLLPKRLQVFCSR